MTTEPILHYLLVYHLDSGDLDIEEFGTDADRAIVAYGEREHEFADRIDVEVVLLGSDSLETIRTTHSHYFAGASRDLVGEIEQLIAARAG